MGSFKGDIQATRSTAAARCNSNYCCTPVRLRGIIIASDAAGAGTFLELTTSANSGTTLFHGDVPSWRCN
jgi:hypothetical protein